MKNTMYVLMLCILMGAVPVRLQAQAESYGSAVAPVAPQPDQQRELVETQKRLAELRAAMARSQASSSSSSDNRPSQYGRSGSSGYATTSVSRGRSTGRAIGAANVFLPGAAPEAAVLIVPAAGAVHEDVVNTQDDLQVMSRLLQKQLEQAGIVPLRDDASLMMYGMMMAGPYGGSVPWANAQSLYLAGYGAVFQLSIDFPLSGVTEEQAERTGGQEDTLWVQTRLELLDPEAARRAKDNDKQEIARYEPERVEGLKKTLIHSLKYTRNVRTLQPEERAVIVVMSTADRVDATPTSYFTTLVLSASKGDIDQFAEGKLTYEQFQQKVERLMY